MIFFGGRFSLLPIHKNLFYIHGNENKFLYVLELLSKRVEFPIRKDINLIIEPILNSNGVLLGGKIGRESIRKLPLSKELTKTPTKMYPYIIFIVNEKEQVILFERNTTVFSDELVVFKYLIKYLNKELFIKGIEVDIKPLTTKGGFWKLIKEMEKVYSVQFIFKVPNFLGDSYSELRDILNKEKEDSNANQVQYGIENDSGELSLTEKDRYKAVIGWIEDGAGEWRLKAKPQGRGKRRKIYTNSEQITTFEVEIEIDILDEEVLKELREKLDIGPHRIKGEDI